jgi:hypothetical protein
LKHELLKLPRKKTLNEDAVPSLFQERRNSDVLPQESTNKRKERQETRKLRQRELGKIKKNKTTSCVQA